MTRIFQPVGSTEPADREGRFVRGDHGDVAAVLPVDLSVEGMSEVGKSWQSDQRESG